MKSMFWKELLRLLLFTLGGILLTMLLMAVMLAVSGSSVTLLHVTQWGQTLFMMALPPVLWAKFYLHEPVANALNLWRPRWEWMVLTFCLMVVSVPLMDQLSVWNAQIPLPGELQAHAEQQRATNNAVLEKMLNVDGIGGWTELILLLTVGTAVGEELMFRGGLLRCFRHTKLSKGSVAVLIGLIFSLIHFDLQGLLPRWILGTLLVYLVWWSGSIWPAVLAHAVNNLMALLSAKLNGVDDYMAMTDWGWGMLTLSAVLTCALLYIMCKRRVDMQPE